jgi:hypothetical protein
VVQQAVGTEIPLLARLLGGRERWDGRFRAPRMIAKSLFIFGKSRAVGQVTSVSSPKINSKSNSKIQGRAAGPSLFSTDSTDFENGFYRNSDPTRLPVYSWEIQGRALRLADRGSRRDAGGPRGRMPVFVELRRLTWPESQLPWPAGQLIWLAR